MIEKAKVKWKKKTWRAQKKTCQRTHWLSSIITHENCVLAVGPNTFFMLNGAQMHEKINSEEIEKENEVKS